MLHATYDVKIIIKSF